MNKGKERIMTDCYTAKGKVVGATGACCIHADGRMKGWMVVVGGD